MMKGALNPHVLVLGGGLAGLRAALEAARSGARVLCACKGRAGAGGCSAITTGGYAAALGPGDSPARHLRDTLRGGAGLSVPRLAWVLAREGAQRLRDLDAAGARFERGEGGALSLFPSGDHGVARVAMPEAGAPRGRPAQVLRRLAEAAGVEFFEGFLARDVALDASGAAAGGAGLHEKTGEAVVIRAGAVVLATGGAGRLFPVTSNPEGVTGDGFALALRAGAHLRDMEFVQFYPWRVIEPFSDLRVSVQPSTFTVGARLLNALGEAFMERADPVRRDAAPRDVSARAIFREMAEGRGVSGGVMLDLSGVPRDVFRETNPRLFALCERRGVNPWETPLVLAPEAHFFMGGVVTGEDGETGVPGLFAVGEVAGGVHGANRCDSNALPETQVFGARAGRAAAALALSRPAPAIPDARPPAPSFPAHAAGETDVEARMIRRDIRETASRTLGIVRDAAGLTEGLGRLRELRGRIAALSARAAPGGRARLIECESLALTAEACALSALFRTESRGAHFREDFPETAPGAARAVVTSMEAGGTLAVRFAPRAARPERR